MAGTDVVVSLHLPEGGRETPFLPTHNLSDDLHFCQAWDAVYVPCFCGIVGSFCPLLPRRIVGGLTFLPSALPLKVYAAAGMPVL